MSGGLGRDSLGRQIRDGRGEYGLRILRAAQQGTDRGGGESFKDCCHIQHYAIAKFAPECQFTNWRNL